MTEAAPSELVMVSKMMMKAGNAETGAGWRTAESMGLSRWKAVVVAGEQELVSGSPRTTIEREYRPQRRLRRAGSSGSRHLREKGPLSTMLTEGWTAGYVRRPSAGSIGLRLPMRFLL